MGAVGGILLAAGESRRMGYPKPLLSIGRTTFIEYTSLAMLEAVDRLVIVLGAHAERVRSALPRDDRIMVVENPDYRLGQLSSLRVGIAASEPACSGVMVHLADHPTVRVETYRRLRAEFTRRGLPILVAAYRWRRGHPVVFARSTFDELMAAPLAEGARSVVNAQPARVGYVETADPGVVLNLDTPADLARARLGLPPDGPP